LGRAAAVLSLAFALASLAGCGFRLEGSGRLPPQMSKTYVQTTVPSTVFYTRLRDALRLRGLEIVMSPEEAGATLTISEDQTGQRVLSVSARNIPREYEIFYTVTFSVRTDDGALIEPESLVATRSYTYDETQVLGKAQEERILRRALAEDLARQIVRRIEAVGGADASVVPRG
jgi:LPS-assembly lipoprotein